jgi:hypothetical protein
MVVAMVSASLQVTPHAMLRYAWPHTLVCRLMVARTKKLTVLVRTCVSWVLRCSRPAAGMRKQTLIVNLPGSSKAVKEVSTRPNPISSFFVLCSSFYGSRSAVQNIDVLLPVLPHAIGLLRQDPRAAQPSQHHKLDMK